jgi:glycosyltransferase involved in cell wall biosynthesis
LVTPGVTGHFGTDEAGLAAALGGLLASAEERLVLGREARARAAERFGPEALANRLEGIYATLLASRA